MGKIVGQNVKQHTGKGSKQEILPHRSALTQLTQGDPSQRTLGNYAKATPDMNNSPDLGGMMPGGGTSTGPYG